MEVKMDIFVEQIVKKNVTGKDWAFRIFIGIAMGILSAVSFFVFFMLIPMLAMLGMLALFGIFWGGWRLITNSDCEYEYIVTNGEIDIDKIIAKRKRVRLITAKASSFEAFGEYTDSTPQEESGATVVSAVGENEALGENGAPVEAKTYYADFKHPAAGNVRLIFSPEKKVIDALTPFFSAQLKLNLRKMNK